MRKVVLLRMQFNSSLFYYYFKYKYIYILNLDDNSKIEKPMLKLVSWVWMGFVWVHWFVSQFLL